MAITVNGTVSSTKTSESATPTTSLTGVASGEGVVVIVVLDNAATTVSGVTVGTQTPSQVGSVFASTNLANGKIYAYVLASSTETGSLTVTATLTGGTPDTRVTAWRISGHHATSPIGATNTAEGEADDPSISLTTTADNSMIVSALMAIGTPSVGTGYTQAAWFDDVTMLAPVMIQYDEDVGATDTKSVPHVTASADLYAGRVFEIKAAAGGPAAAKVLMMMGVG